MRIHKKIILYALVFAGRLFQILAAICGYYLFAKLLLIKTPVLFNPALCLTCFLLMASAITASYYLDKIDKPALFRL